MEKSFKWPKKIWRSYFKKWRFSKLSGWSRKAYRDHFYTLQIEWSVKVFSRFPQFRSYLEVIFYGNRKREQIILSRHWNYMGARLQPQFTENLFLVTYTVTFKVFFTFYKFGMVCILIYRCLRICSNWTQFHTELTFLKKILREDCSPENFIDKCFKHFLNNIHLVKENVPTVGKKVFTPSPSILRNNNFAS